MIKPLAVSSLVITAYVAGLIWLIPGDALLPFLLLVLSLLSLCTLILYALDKRAAVHQRQRIPEKTLHLLALAGGWPGALLARPLFRHKTRKQPFSFLFWCSAMLSGGLLLVFLIVDPAAPARAWLNDEVRHWYLFVQQSLSR